MLLDDYYTRLVGYVVADLRDEDTGKLYRDPVGTVFFVSAFLGRGLGMIGYAITCRHIVEGLNERGISDAYIRLNRARGGGVLDLRSTLKDWVVTADSDVAACRVDLPPEVAFWQYPLPAALPIPPKLGHDVFFVGLFEKLPGVNSVEAIARFGKVARPLSRLPIEVGPSTEIEVEAHLVEATSWGGESGSPVFIYTDKYKLVDAPMPGLFDEFKPPEKDRVILDVEPLLVGMVHGHYPLHREVRHRKHRIGGVEINSGIAVVIPVEHIRRLVMETPKFIEDRERVIADRSARNRKLATPKPDAASGLSSEEQSSDAFTKEDFEAALKKVSRKIEPEKANE